MIVTLTPNTAIDKTYVVEDFGMDRVHRPISTHTIAGGKGINVARVLRMLGRDTVATGFVGGWIGEAILTALKEEGINFDFTRVRGESRLCIAIMDPTNDTQTEVNENGPNITSDEIKAMMKKVDELVRGAEMLVLSGSCPPGVPLSFYGDLIEIAHRQGVRTVLDTSGEHLKEAIKASPFMIKPNVAELSQLAGRELFTLEEICRAAKSLKQYGISITAVTMGRMGAMVTDGVHSWTATPPEIQFASAVGSGDSFVAGFLDSYLKDGSIKNALIWGTSAGTANATTYGAGFCSKSCIMEIAKGITLSKLR